MKFKNLARDLGLVILSNLLTLVISTIVILVVPKVIGVKEYGYWQLFMFYASYLGFFHLGWIDGIYLRYGGTDYQSLDKSLFFSQFVMLMMMEACFAAIIVFVTFCFQNADYVFIQISLAIYLLIFISQSYLKIILQLTNRIREFSQVTILSNTVYVIILAIQILTGFKNFRFLITAFIFGNFVAMIYGVVLLKDLFYVGVKKITWSWKEACLNVRVGLQLLLANAASLLIIGVVRIGIQHGWGVTTFGKVSLTLSISNLLMVFISAISLILFPKLRKIDNKKIKDLYSAIRDILMPFVFIGILVYFPLNYLIPLWLPKYQTTLIYMSLLFPMIVYQAKFDILSNTFLKVFRMEKQLLFINIFTLIISLFMTLLSVFWLHNLTFTISNIIIVMSIRSTLSEIYVKSRLKIKFSVEIFIETLMVIIFIALAWNFSNWMAMGAYMVVLLVYLFIKKNDILKAFSTMRKL
ncbi:lipopolysaccharide biosynthesis protein [Leuconostoc mesenteroides]|uniref:lipopolysaccharide biosynthesis protein n=1 Tax=Leuconostoc mesenteroides TaxID=1245 RepID=UPI000B8D4C46|nr:hypothetical protein [Leuconostoc mesenteroides]ASR69476.1 hypothetical protein CBW60_08915 [Leuconostoc mesenteroides]QHM55587.1 hypothetical protein C7M43_00287 [Leuconostoc mesenteroides]